MTSPRTFWLTVTNAVLGLAVVACLLFVCAEELRAALSKRAKRRSFDAELDHDMEEMFGVPRSRRLPRLARLRAWFRKRTVH